MTLSPRKRGRDIRKKKKIEGNDILLAYSVKDLSKYLKF